MVMEYNNKPDHWIQVELDVRGHMTGAVQINLKLVQRVQIVRASNNLAEVRVRYDNETLVLKKESGVSFLESWNAYQPMAKTDPPAQPSNIHSGSEDGGLFKLNPQIR